MIHFVIQQIKETTGIFVIKIYFLCLNKKLIFALVPIFYILNNKQ